MTLKKVYYVIRVASISVALICMAYFFYIGKQKDEAFDKGYKFSEQKDYANALKQYDLVVELAPSNRDIYKYRANVYVNIKNYDKAIADYTKAIELDPIDSNLYIYRAGVYFLQLNFEAAINDYSQYIKIFPEYTAAYFYRGLSYYQAAKFDLAQNDILKTKSLEQGSKFFEDEFVKYVPMKINSDKENIRAKLLAILRSKNK